MRAQALRTMLVAALSLATFESASAGIDQLFQKSDDKPIWGQVIEWAVGKEGFGKSYALVIGISDYTGGFEALPSTANDPIRMRDFLLEEAGFDYVHVLTDEKATKPRIGTLLEEVFPDLVQSDDRFFFYWSGHGTQTADALEKPLGYLPLAGSGRRQFSSMVSMDDLARWDRRIRAKHALFLLDSCFSGLAGSQVKSPLRDFTIARLAKPAHHLITAGTGEEETIAGRRWRGSLFTDTFIEAARGAADAQNNFPRDGVVNLAELMAYTRQRIDHERRAANWTKAITPQWSHLRANQGEFFFVTAARKRKVAKVGNEVPISAGLPVVKGPGEAPAIVPACDADADRLFWETIKDKDKSAYFEAYLERVEAGELCGRFASLATIELDMLRMVPIPELPATEAVESDLPRERVTQVQEMLADLAFDPGPLDGVLGEQAHRAIEAFQRSIGRAATGTLTEEDELALAKAYADHRTEDRKAAIALPSDHHTETGQDDVIIAGFTAEPDFLETTAPSNIRTSPAADARWVMAVPAGARLEVLDRNDSLNWYEIRTLDGETGYISGSLVRPIEDKPAVEQKSASAPAPIPAQPGPDDSFEAPAAEEFREISVAASVDHVPEPFFQFVECDDCPPMVTLPPGRFEMGSTDGDQTEQPVHDVTLQKTFAIGKFEVTVGQWQRCADAGFCRRIKNASPAEDSMPIRNVSWADAEAYVHWLSKETGKPYRLPTEAEWEYAARGAQTTKYWWGEELLAGHVACADCGGTWDRKRPADVGSFKPNPFGLHDMNGGVSEWVADCWVGNYDDAPSNGRARKMDGCLQRVLRGGSWRSETTELTSSSRLSYDAQVSYYTNGFRVARDLE